MTFKNPKSEQKFVKLGTIFPKSIQKLFDQIDAKTDRVF